MLDHRLMTIILRDRELEIAESLRVRSLLDGRQPEPRRSVSWDVDPSVLFDFSVTPRVALRSR